ncbi:serine carboxypeptidase S28-domain-containing protein [Coprinopsis sp. MPI-PUGE-AT-0042]|nr:serine carboxypeptidase S28-domain-containing protein [Coprinopsis sp. MPI-PUGE-AT-0042]
MALRLHLFAVLLSVVHVQCLSKRGGIHLLGPQAVNLWKLDQNSQSAEIAKDFDFAVQAPLGQAASPSYDFRAEWFQQPLDHFDKSVNHTWHQRFWVNSRHYRPRSGAPVIVIDGGETSGEDRLSFLDTGIADILAKATGGIGVVLEHRYYGASVPVANFSTDAMRWLNNAQSAADSANFMSNVQFDGIQEDITAPNTPWIYYGGSYAGARAAHMKVLYPELVYGAIASSAVTHAQLANWEYMTIIRDAADPTCSSRLVNSIATIDSILQRGTFKRQLKALFGLADLTHDEDFASVLEAPLGEWQSKCWHPDFISTNFDDFCKTLAKPFGWFSDADVEALTFGDERRMVTIDKDFAVDFAIVNYGRWIKKNIVSKCKGTIEECFGTFDDKQYHNTGLDQEWRLWLFQVCTEWGYFTTPPPNQNEPSIISRLITLGYESKICKQAFPPGVHMRVPSLPNITVVNELGDFDLAADRLAFIDGEVDPWRPYTPHSRYADDREDTLLRPFKLIPGGVHHWDEWGLKNILEEPAEIRKIHSEIIEFVREWLKDWKAPNTTNI